MVTLVTGSTGKLGRELVKAFTGCLHPKRAELDIRKQSQVDTYFQDHRPDTVVHAAALTGIRECEENQKLAWETNVLGTDNLVKAVEQHCPRCRFLYVSTACVFKGNRAMYTEEDIPYPENFYALTKLLGEFLVRRLPNHVIVRINFVAREKWRYPKAFTDRFGTYLFADEVTLGIRDVVESNLTGIVHIVGDRKMSVFELAKLTTPDVQPMTMNEYKGPPLTIDMSLDTVRWKRYRLRAVV